VRILPARCLKKVTNFLDFLWPVIISKGKEIREGKENVALVKRRQLEERRKKTLGRSSTKKITLHYTYILYKKKLANRQNKNKGSY
jgi:hypothetical protein